MIAGAIPALVKNIVKIENNISPICVKFESVCLMHFYVHCHY